jgi:hypothetical protein
MPDTAHRTADSKLRTPDKGCCRSDNVYHTTHSGHHTPAKVYNKADSACHKRDNARRTTGTACNPALGNEAE